MLTLLVAVGRFGWLGMIGAMIGVPLLIALVHALVVAVFGYTLEPVAEGGRLPLGEADESEIDERS
jgi:hypothetical protein